MKIEVLIIGSVRIQKSCKVETVLRRKAYQKVNVSDIAIGNGCVQNTLLFIYISSVMDSGTAPFSWLRILRVNLYIFSYFYG